MHTKRVKHEKNLWHSFSDKTTTRSSPQVTTRPLAGVAFLFDDKIGWCPDGVPFFYQTFLWGGFCADDQDDGAARKRRVVAAPGGFVRQDECCFCATQIVALPMNGWARHCWISQNLALHRASNTFTIPENLVLCRSINTHAVLLLRKRPVCLGTCPSTSLNGKRVLLLQTMEALCAQPHQPLPGNCGGPAAQTPAHG